MLFPNTFNISTDSDTFTAGMQTQVGIQTDSSRVWRVGVRITDLETSETNEYYIDNITADQTLVGSSPIDLPEGQVMVEPLCVLNNQSTPFGYPDQREIVYVDTISPECPTNLSCTHGNPRVAEIMCTWTTSDDPGVDPDIEEWDVRYSDQLQSLARAVQPRLWPTESLDLNGRTYSKPAHRQGAAGRCFLGRKRWLTSVS